jgi:uncharacterized membrane protein YeaQ/YmgE (transglycosylase-associated protein family)
VRVACLHGPEVGLGLLGDIVVGLLAGWAAGLIRRGRGYGLIGNLLVGVLGAFVGDFVLGLVGLYAQGFLGSLVAATLGALGFLYLFALARERWA